jgi:hypothetical protein
MIGAYDHSDRTLISMPISRKMREFSAKATYSQKVSTAARVAGDIPVRAP